MDAAGDGQQGTEEWRRQWPPLRRAFRHVRSITAALRLGPRERPAEERHLRALASTEAFERFPTPALSSLARGRLLYAGTVDAIERVAARAGRLPADRDNMSHQAI